MTAYALRLENATDTAARVRLGDLLGLTPAGPLTARTGIRPRGAFNRPSSLAAGRHGAETLRSGKGGNGSGLGCGPSRQHDRGKPEQPGDKGEGHGHARRTPPPLLDNPRAIFPTTVPDPAPVNPALPMC